MVNINYLDLGSEEVYVEIVDLDGRIAFSGLFQINPEYGHVDIPVKATWAAGYYIVRSSYGMESESAKIYIGGGQ